MATTDPHNEGRQRGQRGKCVMILAFGIAYKQSSSSSLSYIYLTVYLIYFHHRAPAIFS
jgi:hypothetical protein